MTTRYTGMHDHTLHRHAWPHATQPCMASRYTGMHGHTLHRQAWPHATQACMTTRYTGMHDHRQATCAPAVATNLPALAAFQNRLLHPGHLQKGSAPHPHDHLVLPVCEQHTAEKLIIATRSPELKGCNATHSNGGFSPPLCLSLVTCVCPSSKCEQLGCQIEWSARKQTHWTCMMSNRPLPNSKLV